MKLVAPADLYVVALGDYVDEGEVIEVDDDTGASLKAQGWKGAGNRKPDKSSLRDIEPDEVDDPATPSRDDAKENT